VRRRSCKIFYIRRSCFLWQATCFQRLSIRKFDQVARRLHVQIVFAADFADIFEADPSRGSRSGPAG
jgi:hypothetical protein